MQYIINASAIILFHKGKPVKVDKGTSQYARILTVLQLPEDEQDAALEAALNGEADVAACKAQGFEIDTANDTVSYQNEKLPKVLAEKVIALSRDNLPLSLFVKFWENLRLNPSFSSVNELYDFLAYKELPLTEDGCFLAYKGVGENDYSVHGNMDTTVLKGIVDSTGHIYNGIGEVVEVPRRGVCDDRTVHCAADSLHVGSLKYASGWGPKVVVVKINPKDVVSVPNDCKCQKCRVCCYEVVSSFTQEITAPVVDRNNAPVLSLDVTNYNAFVDRVGDILRDIESKGYTTISVLDVQDLFVGPTPSVTAILDAADALGYNYMSFEESDQWHIDLE